LAQLRGTAASAATPLGIPLLIYGGQRRFYCKGRSAGKIALAAERSATSVAAILLRARANRVDTGYCTRWRSRDGSATRGAEV